MDLPRQLVPFGQGEGGYSVRRSPFWQGIGRTQRQQRQAIVTEIIVNIHFTRRKSYNSRRSSNRLWVRLSPRQTDRPGRCRGAATIPPPRSASIPNPPCRPPRGQERAEASDRSLSSRSPAGPTAEPFRSIRLLRLRRRTETTLALPPLQRPQGHCAVAARCIASPSVAAPHAHGEARRRTADPASPPAVEQSPAPVPHAVATESPSPTE